MNFTSCFTNLKHLEELEVIDQSQVSGQLNIKPNIVLFRGPNNGINQLSTNTILKKFQINNVNVSPKEFKLIFKVCPFIEELGLIKCGFSYKDTLDVIELVSCALTKLKIICYTHEYYPEKKVPKSTKSIFEKCSALQRVEFNPKITLGESFDNVFEKFYNSLSSIATIRHFYDFVL